jgi:hypothetical protein
MSVEWLISILYYFRITTLSQRFLVLSTKCQWFVSKYPNCFIFLFLGVVDTNATVFRAKHHQIWFLVPSKTDRIVMGILGRAVFVQDIDRNTWILGNIIHEFYFWREGYRHWISGAKYLNSPIIKTNKCTNMYCIIPKHIKTFKKLLHVSIYDHHQGAHVVPCWST